MQLVDGPHREAAVVDPRADAVVQHVDGQLGQLADVLLTVDVQDPALEVVRADGSARMLCRGSSCADAARAGDDGETRPRSGPCAGISRATGILPGDQPDEVVERALTPPLMPLALILNEIRPSCMKSA